MTQTEFAEKYDVQLTFISSLISQKKIEPIGRIMGKTKMVKDFSEKTMVETVLTEYQNRYQADAASAKKWRDKAVQIKETYRRSKNGNQES